MPFFEPPERPEEDEPEDDEFEGPEFGPPKNELPGLVPYPVRLAATDAGAIGISAIAAYARGFNVTVQAIAARRPSRGRLYDPLQWLEVPPGELADELIRFGIELADGTKLTNVGLMAFDDETDTLAEAGMFPGAGGGGDRDWETEFWVWPLPPQGPLAFVCEWPAMGIPETRHEIDARLVRDAAERSRSLWP